MSDISNPAERSLTANYTVKLHAALQRRVRRAMAMEGFTVWAEFCRVALTEKCQAVEARQIARGSMEIN